MSRMLHRLLGPLSTPGPSVGLEIAADRVTATALTWTKSTPKLTAHASVPLPEGVLEPTAAGTNMVDRAVVIDAVRRVLGQLPRRTTRIGLVVPDSVAKVSFVKFDKVPGRSADLERLVWLAGAEGGPVPCRGCAAGVYPRPPVAGWGAGVRRRADPPRYRGRVRKGSVPLPACTPVS